MLKEKQTNKRRKLLHFNFIANKGFYYSNRLTYTDSNGKEWNVIAYHMDSSLTEEEKEYINKFDNTKITEATATIHGYTCGLPHDVICIARWNPDN